MGEGSLGWAGLIFLALDIWPWLLAGGLLLLLGARLAGGRLGAVLALGALPLLAPVAMVGGLVAGEDRGRERHYCLEVGPLDVVSGLVA